mmetsp:Transcript_48800/g.114266  ORF Transcript_48800/g.114266 Transcript_48800/m.114266 type:complete len:86 (+) Transcript_48800:166-423(+)
MPSQSRLRVDVIQLSVLHVAVGYQHMQDRVRPRWRIRAEKDVKVLKWGLLRLDLSAELLRHHSVLRAWTETTMENPCREGTGQRT